jgi:hypothetical protein
MVRQLPTFKGYTVDVRTRQFRKAELGQPLEFVDFTSEKGMDLILEMEENPKAITTFQGEDPNEVAYMADKAMRHEVSNRRRSARQAAEPHIDE